MKDNPASILLKAENYLNFEEKANIMFVQNDHKRFCFGKKRQKPTIDMMKTIDIDN